MCRSTERIPKRGVKYVHRRWGFGKCHARWLFLEISRIFGDLGLQPPEAPVPLNPKKWENPEISTEGFTSAALCVPLRTSAFSALKR
jgi:hypothetical protein